MKIRLVAIFVALHFFSSAVSAVSTCNCVAFKLLEISDSVSGPAQEVLDLFQDYDIPLTLGIQANQFSSSNDLVSTIRQGLNEWNFELACNGNQLQDYSTASEDQQTSDLLGCTSAIQSLFSVRPRTFLPPGGSPNDATTQAMVNTGYTFLSGGQRSSSVDTRNNSIQNFPSQIDFSNGNSGQAWSRIQDQLSQNGFSVVSMATSQLRHSQIDQLSRLLWLVRSSGKRVVLIRDIANFQNVPFYPPCVAFRLDDIQDYYTTSQQIHVMQTFQDYSAPLSVGIIANHFGSDSNIVNAVKNFMRSPGFEIHSHGWNHEDFSTFSETDQENLLSQSVTSIQSQLGVAPKYFIPPFNAWNQNTITALKNQGFTVMSADTMQDPAPYSTRTAPPSNGLWRWPAGAQTSEINDAGYYVGIPASDSFNQISAQISNFGFSVVMLHPSEFAVYQDGTLDTNSVDTDHLDDLAELIEMVGLSGFKITTVSDLQNC